MKVLPFEVFDGAPLELGGYGAGGARVDAHRVVLHPLNDPLKVTVAHQVLRVKVSVKEEYTG